ncbi:MAG: hypothetical protein R2725_13405 [Solirubrobacterales bacterium]
MRWRSRHRTEPEPSGLFERAAARFNASPAGATVAGLTRTLGVPRVSVGAAAAAPGLIRVTVAWELTWYQWGVDLGDAGRPVFELRRGTELAELDAAARQWNAAAGEGGRIVIGAPRAAPAGAAAPR